MEVQIKDIEKLLAKKTVLEIENRIAENIDCKIYKENPSVLLKLVQQNIMKSSLEINKIENVLLKESENIIKFATLFLSEENINNLSLGISILYAIYWIFLSSKSEKELLEYINLRRIPQSKKVVNQLQQVYKIILKD